MKCKNCGNEVNPQDAFCQYCGSPVSPESNSADTETTVLKRQTNDAETSWLFDDAETSSLKGLNDETETSFLGMGSADRNGGNQTGNNGPYNNGGNPNGNGPYNNGGYSNGNGSYNNGGYPNGRDPYNNGGQSNGNGPYNNAGQPNRNGSYNNAGQLNGNGPYNNAGQPNGNGPYNNGGNPNYNGQPNMGYQPNGGFQQGNGATQVVKNMKWFHFIIYVQLYLATLFHAGRGMLAIVGNFVYSMESVNGLLFIDRMKLANIIWGLFSIALAAFTVYVRYMLAAYKKDSPKLYYMLWIANVVLSLIYYALLICILNDLIDSELMTEVVSEIATLVIIAIGYIAMNIKYFKKRAHLFVN